MQSSFLRVRVARARAATTLVVAVCLVVGPSAFTPAYAAGGSLSGTVAEATTQTEIQDATIEAFPFDGTTLDTDNTYSTSTDETGGFVLDGLPAGQFKVRISDEAGHVAEYYDDAADLAISATVPVVDGQDTPLRPIALAVGGGFTGTVEGDDAEGTPIERPRVEALRVVNGLADLANPYAGDTDGVGGYSIRGLPAGDYKLKFTGNPGYFDEFFNDKATEAEADLQTAQPGIEAPLGPTVLEQTAATTGIVTDAGGASLGGILVQAHPVVGGVVVAAGVDDATTESDGFFNVDELRSGTYVLKIRDGLHRYQDQVSTPITVEGGESADAGTFALALAPVVAPVVPAPVVKKSATVKVSAKGAKKKATLTILVRAAGVVPSGRVTIKLGSKTLKTVKLKGGKVKVTLTKQKKGKRTYKVIYSGDSKVRAKTVTKKVAIK